MKIEQARDASRYAAEEQALVLKNQMHEKELASKERMLKYQLEFAQLNQGQVPVPLDACPVDLVQEGNSTNAYPSCMGTGEFSQDLFAFSTGTTTMVMTTTPLHSTSCQWPSS
jgi:hypothetical protein